MTTDLELLQEAHDELKEILEGLDGILGSGVAGGQLVVRIRSSVDVELIPGEINGISVAISNVDNGEWWL